ncbi:MAG: PQQ-binding-like beta-propeller repeat protein [Phycisphaerae bacterium]
MKRTLLCTLTTVCLLSVVALAADWPQWRGPGGDGVLPDAPELTRTLIEKPEPLWSAQAIEHMPDTHASPVIADGRAYLHTSGEYRVKKDGKNRKLSKNVILCVSLKDGKKLWRVEESGQTDETPCVADGKLYHVSSNGELICRDAAKGNELWKLKVFKGGMKSSPIPAGDAIVLFRKGTLMVVDTKEKAIRWKKRKLKTMANSPAIWTHKGETYVLAGNQEVVCANVKNGEVLWTMKGTKLKKDPSTPAIVGDRMATLWEGGGLIVYELTLEGPKKIAEAKEFEPQGGGAHQALSPAFDGKRVYGVDGKKTFCFDVEKGEMIWTAKKGETHCSPILAGDLLISPSKHTTRLIDAKTGKILTEAKIRLRGCSSPAMSNNLLLINAGRTMECYDLSKQANLAANTKDSK